MNYLVSFPRSGNTFMRYCIEYFSGRPTLGCKGGDPKKDRPMYLRENNLIINDKTPIIRKTHKWTINNKETNKIILVIRNPKDCFLSHAQRSLKKENYNRIENLGLSYTQNFMKNLINFDKYNDEKKLLIYYEDFVNDKIIERELRKLLLFLNLKDDKLPTFINNLKFHKKQSISNYYGKKLENKIKLDNEIVENWFKKLLQINFNIYHKYLKRYLK